MVENVAKHCANLMKQNWSAVKQILTYVTGTINYVFANSDLMSISALTHV